MHYIPFLRGIYCCSGSGIGSIIEPLSAVPLNDELQQARASVAKAEADVLSMLTEKVAISHNEISFHWPYNNFTPYVFMLLFSLHRCKWILMILKSY